MQQVNLYQEMFKPQRRSMAGPALLATFVVMCMAMAGVSWRQSRSLAKLEQQYQAATAQQQQLLVELETVQQKLATVHPSALLVQKLLVTRQQLAQRQPLLQQLEQLAVGKNQVAESLEALARRPLKKLWFTRVHVGGAGTDLQLSGKAIDAERLPELVRTLGREQVFAQRQFSFLRLQRQDDGLYDFALSTEVESSHE
ncbi:MAG: PilN domain-containing protein [Desulfuromonas sp.]|nr:PilN domain-containing protein [Desulfuromonas sp.]